MIAWSAERKEKHMKQSSINRAYAALVKLVDYKLPVRKAFEIYKLTKAIEAQYQFAVSEERKYIDEFGGKINPDGTVSFETPEKFGAYQEKALALSEMDVEIDFTPVSLSVNDIGEQTISPVDIYNLEGFVSFDG